MIARKLLKMYPEFTQRTNCNIWTVDESCVHFTSSSENVAIKYGLPKLQEDHPLQKRCVSVKVMYAIFFNCRSETVQVAIPPWKNGYLEIVLTLGYEKVRKVCDEARPRLGLQRITLLHDNVPAHTSKETNALLKKKGLTILPHPPYPPD